MARRFKKRETDAMPCHTFERTNKRLERILSKIEELISWADQDEQHARENDAPGTARDDHRRGTALRKVRTLLSECRR